MPGREDVGDAGAPVSWRATLWLLAMAGGLLAIRLDLPAFFDNEGRYAEVARGMYTSGDWITPRIEGTLFLNKPPLIFWLTALAYHVVGVGEWARIVSVLAALATIAGTCRLGGLLWGERTGLLAGVLLATTVGFVLEARTLRPESVIVASVVWALYCWLRAERAAAGQRDRWMIGVYASLAIGVLAKGLVPLVAAIPPIVFTAWRDHRWGAWQRLRVGLGISVLAAIVLPWHLAVAWLHEGFAWDYVVNQHILVFFDKKFPHDHIGDTIGFFWGAFAGRAVPWVFLAPLGLAEAWGGWRREASPATRAAFFVVAWAGGMMAFYSLSPARLEHYALPAIPVVALLGARVVERLRTGELDQRVWIWFGTLAVGCVGLGAFGVIAGRDLLTQTYWIAQLPDLVALAAPAATIVLAGGLLASVAVWRRGPGGFVAALAVATPLVLAIVVRALVAAEPLFSWRPVAQVLDGPDLPEGAAIVFESPEEYQIVAGLSFYADKPITFMEPPGFIPPTYLEGLTQEMFVSRDEFDRRWQSGDPIVLVTDPQRRRDRVDDLLPPPPHTLARFGDRWVLTNFPVVARR